MPMPLHPKHVAQATTLVLRWLHTNKCSLGKEAVETHAKAAAAMVLDKESDALWPAVRTIMENSDDVVRDFKLKITVSGGEVRMDYLDGTSVEVGSFEDRADFLAYMARILAECASEAEEPEPGEDE